VPCRATVAPLHDAAHEAYELRDLVPRGVVLDQTNTAIWAPLSSAQPPVDVLVISAHCSVDHMGKASVGFVDRRGKLQQATPNDLRKELWEHGKDLGLLFLNGCSSFDLAYFVMAEPGRPRSLRCTICWSTVVNSRAARAFSYEFFARLYPRDVNGAITSEQLPADSAGFIEAYEGAVQALQGDPNKLHEAHRAAAAGGVRWLVGDPALREAREQAVLEGRQVAGIPGCVLIGDGGRVDIWPPDLGR
jgi:hypothetical protein